MSFPHKAGPVNPRPPNSLAAAIPRLSSRLSVRSRTNPYLSHLSHLDDGDEEPEPAWMSAVSVPGSSGDAIVLKRGAAKVYVGSAVVKATVTLLENPDFSFDLEYADCSTAEDRRPPLRLPLSSSTTAILSGENDNVVVVQTPQKPGWLGATEIRFTTMARVERTTWIEKIEAAVDALLARPRTSLTGRTYFSITKPTVDTIVGIELLKAVDAEVEGVVIGALSADGAAERHARPRMHVSHARRTPHHPLPLLRAPQACWQR